MINNEDNSMLYLVTKSPDQIIEINVKDFSIQNKIKIPTFQRQYSEWTEKVSTIPSNMALWNNKIVISVGSSFSTGLVVYDVDKKEWNSLPLPDDLNNSDEWNLTGSPGALWGIETNSSPSSIYQWDNGGKFKRFSGHDYEDVECSSDIENYINRQILLVNCNGQLLFIDQDNKFQYITRLSNNEIKQVNNNKDYYTIQIIDKFRNKVAVGLSWQPTYNASEQLLPISQIDVIDLESQEVVPVLSALKGISINHIELDNNHLWVEGVVENEHSSSVKIFHKLLE